MIPPPDPCVRDQRVVRHLPRRRCDAPRLSQTMAPRRGGTRPQRVNFFARGVRPALVDVTCSARFELGRALLDVSFVLITKASPGPAGQQLVRLDRRQTRDRVSAGYAGAYISLPSRRTGV